MVLSGGTFIAELFLSFFDVIFPKVVNFSHEPRAAPDSLGGVAKFDPRQAP